MSKTNGTAFGRPFAPMIAVAQSGNKPGYSTLNNIWNQYIEPYRLQWAHPDDGVIFGFYLHVLYWAGFYTNSNNLPSNPTNPNSSGYDWSYLDGIHTQVAALNDGRAKLHFRIDTESSGVPGFLVNRGDSFLGVGDRAVPAWHRSSVQNDMINFLTALASRYNGAAWLAHISFEEDNAGTNTPSDWSLNAWTTGRANTVRHAYNIFTQHTIFLAQSSGVHDHLNDIPVGRWMDDTKPGAFSCGSSNQGYPVYDCQDTVLRGIQLFNGTIQNPPGGLAKPVCSSSMPNGWGSRNDGNYGRSNPWGQPYPIPGETSNPSAPAADTDWNATQFLSYTAGQPRAPAPKDDSNLGQPGRDNAGIVPSMVTVVNPVCDTAAAWNRAFQFFGGQGTRACPAVPWDWFSGSTPSLYIPPLGSTWTYQITGTVNTGVNVDNYIIDLFDSSQALVDQLHSQGRKVFAYVSAGTREDWRPDAGNYPSSVLGNALPDWPGERWVDTRALAILRPLIRARMQLAKDRGYDGVDPDNMDGYTNNPGFPMTATHQIAFNKMVAEEAHSLNLSCGLKNAVDLIPNLVAFFDFCVNEEAFRYGEYQTLIPFLNAGKSVFNVEYRSQDLNCALANSLYIYQVLKTLDLNSIRTPCAGFQPPPGGTIPTQANADTVAGVAKNSGPSFIYNSTLTANDTGQNISITSVSNQVNCTATLDVSNARITFTPATNFTGNATFRYTLTGTLGTSQTQVTVPVGNSAPTLFPLSTIQVNAGGNNSTNLTGFDPEGDVLNFTVDSQPSVGIASIGARLAPNSMLLNISMPVDASGLVTGCQVSCTDSDPIEPLKSNTINVVFDVIPGDTGEHSVTIDEDAAIVSGGTWASPPIGGSTFGNVEGADWRVHRVEIQQDYVDVYRPTNAIAGTTLVIVVTCDGNFDLAMTMDPPTGWTSRHNVRVSGMSLAAFDKVMTSNEPAFYTVRKQGDRLEEWCAFSIALPAGSTYNSKAQQSGISLTGIAPSLTPTIDNTFDLFVVASDEPDVGEDLRSFSLPSTMIGNKWSSNTPGMVMLAVGYTTQDTAGSLGERTLPLDVDGSWEGLTLAYSRQSGYTGAYGGDALLSTSGDGGGTVCYTATAQPGIKDWLKVYAQWPNNNINSGTVTYSIRISGADYSDVFVDQGNNGGQMNLLTTLDGPLPSGDVEVCIHDSPVTPVFADAVRIDYKVGESTVITYRKNIPASGTLRAPRSTFVRASSYILTPEDQIFTGVIKISANGIVFDVRDTWVISNKDATKWLYEIDR